MAAADMNITTEVRSITNFGVEKAVLFNGDPVSGVAFVQSDDEGATWETITGKRWAVCLYRDPDDPQRFVTAVVIGLPGVASEGSTEDEAIAAVTEAIELIGDEDMSILDVPAAARFKIPAGGRVTYVCVYDDVQSS